MKSIFFLIGTLLSLSLFAQSQKYQEMKSLLINEGYSIGQEQYVDLTEGQKGTHAFNFSSNYKYIIVAESDDDNVTDVDVCLLNNDRTSYDCDDDNSKVAAVEFSPVFTRTMIVTITNYASNTPYYASRCRFFIAYINQ